MASTALTHCEGSRRRHAEAPIDCEVYEGLDDQEMADLFLGRNKSRVVNTFERFTVAVTAGHTRENAIMRVVTAAKLEIKKDQRKGCIFAVGGLKRVFEKEGAAVLQRVLETLRDARTTRRPTRSGERWSKAYQPVAKVDDCGSTRSVEFRTLDSHGDGQKDRRRDRRRRCGWTRRTFRRVTGILFFERLNRVLEEAGFDAFVEGLCAAFYAARMGRPSLRPGRYFRLLLIGYFEGLSSERGIAWRVADSLSLRSFSGPGRGPRRRRTTRRCRARGG